jgi:hypothetical protein
MKLIKYQKHAWYDVCLPFPDLFDIKLNDFHVIFEFTLSIRGAKKTLNEYGSRTIENVPRSDKLILFSQSDKVTVPTKKPIGIA